MSEKNCVLVCVTVQKDCERLIRRGQALALEEKTLEELLRETGLPVHELSTQLTLLEISGKIERRPGQAYARVRI